MQLEFQRVSKMKRYWKTKNGTRIKIKDMSDGHLINTMKLLIRNALAKRIYTERCYLYPPFGGPSGEGAQYAFDREFDEVLDMTTEHYLPEPWEAMKIEAERRKLKIPEMPNEALAGLLALAPSLTRKLTERTKHNAEN